MRNNRVPVSERFVREKKLARIQMDEVVSFIVTRPRDARYYVFNLNEIEMPFREGRDVQSALAAFVGGGDFHLVLFSFNDFAVDKQLNQMATSQVVLPTRVIDEEERLYRSTLEMSRQRRIESVLIPGLSQSFNPYAVLTFGMTVGEEEALWLYHLGDIKPSEALSVLKDGVESDNIFQN